MGAASILRRGGLGLQGFLQQCILPGDFALGVGESDHGSLVGEAIACGQILPRPIVQMREAIAQCCRATQQPVNVSWRRVFHVKHPRRSLASRLAIFCRISSYSKFDGWIRLKSFCARLM